MDLGAGTVGGSGTKMGGRMRYQGIGQKGFLLACAVAFGGLAAAAELSEETSGSGRLLAALVLVVCAVGGVRLLRSGLFAYDSHLAVRGLFRSRRLDWGEVRAFAVTSGHSLIPWRMLTVEGHDGSCLVVDEVASLDLRNGDHTYAHRAAAELNEALEARLVVDDEGGDRPTSRSGQRTG